MKLKKIITVCIAIVVIAGVSFSVQSYATPNPASTTSSVKTKKFVKTKNKCTKCSCSGYWGYKHQNGTYEGACSNRDCHGYTCGHSPEKHGLKKW